MDNMKENTSNPYTLELGRQLLEIPFQLIHHRRNAKMNPQVEKYRFGSDGRQYLLLWMPPAGAPERSSVVVFYHGGGWRVGWPGINPTVVEFFLEQGFPVVMPGYRLAPWHTQRHMREDLNLALEKILNVLEAKGLSGKKIISAGVSAGATLAALLAYDQNHLTKMGFTQDLFSGFFSISGPLDLDRMPNFKAVRDYAGGRPGSAAFQEANPAFWLSGQEQIPALLLHGTGDAIVPFACSESFADQYAGPLFFHAMPGVSHLRALRFATDDTTTATVIRKWLEDK